MLTHTPPASARADHRDRTAYLCLFAATVLFAFTAGRWAFAPAAWLAPMFLLRFLRSRPVVPGLFIAWLVRYLVAAVVTLPGTVAVTGVRYYVSVLVIITAAMLPYAADRLLTPRLPGLAATLVFPAALVSLEYLTSFGPTGTINSLANSQYGDLPLMQLASVTGIWGITFLIGWFASVINWAWERGFVWPRIRTGTVLYAAVLLVVFLAGEARVALTSPGQGVVRAAAISASKQAAAAASGLLTPHTVAALEAGTATAAQQAAARAAFISLDDDLLAATAQQAQAGAQIIAWPEASAVGAGVLDEDQSAFLQRAAALAREHHIYLELGLGVFLPRSARPPYLKDESVLIDPAGRIGWSYEKTHLVPFREQGVVLAGDGRLPISDSEFGRLAGAICFDQDFPTTMRQAGQAGADILIGPSNDWRAIDPAHADAAIFRAVENGYSLLRPASNGVSLAVDYRGQVRAASDYFTTPDRQVLSAQLPTHGVRTIYSRIGDVFAWICLAGLFVLTVAARPRRSAAPIERRPATSRGTPST
jgi:apolipoprotein N-acyltransferase